MRSLNSYRKIVGRDLIEQIKEEARPLRDKHVVHINSTLYGGGVAEILNSLVPLMNDIGISTGWRVLKGTPEFFVVTKKFHNALQGERIKPKYSRKKIYSDVNKTFSKITHLEKHSCVIVHDVQPLPLINFMKKKQPWVWRCHVDLSNPDPHTYRYLQKFISKYDLAIISNKKFYCPKNKCRVIYPSIDPLSPKNKKMSETKVKRMLSSRGIDLDKPIVAQISRFDKWKDPLGVIKAYKAIKPKINCRLVLLGSMADDDPEGPEIFKKVNEEAKKLKDVVVLAEYNDYLVNALQRASSVVVQKSIKEGFGLTVSEALWKKTPVVSTYAGGIPLQIEDGKTGFLAGTQSSFEKKLLFLLKNPVKAEEMGLLGHEFVKSHFLTTRHLLDYISLIRDIH